MKELTAEEKQALRDVQGALGPDALQLADQIALKLVGTPPEAVDRELQNIGHLLYTAFQLKSPNLSEAMQVGLPFAFIHLVKERLEGMAEGGAV